jgi:hypothetical protein
MASGTADLQRDLGGALMTSIFGALLTAGYAASMGTAITASSEDVTAQTQSQLQLSYASAANLAAANPQYGDQIIAAAESSFLDGDDLAYIAGFVAVLLGAAIVFFRYPKKDDEERARAAYHAEDRCGGEPVRHGCGRQYGNGCLGLEEAGGPRCSVTS